MENHLSRAVQHLIGRITGPLHFRLILHPSLAAFMALRAGIRHAKQGRQAFLWSALFEPGNTGSWYGRGGETLERSS
jgi:hypothetical protein